MERLAAPGLLEVFSSPRRHMGMVEDLWLAGSGGRAIAEGIHAEYRDRMEPFLLALVVPVGFAVAWPALAVAGSGGILAPLALLALLPFARALRDFASVATRLSATNRVSRHVRDWTRRAKGGLLGQWSPSLEHPVELFLLLSPGLAFCAAVGVWIGEWAAQVGPVLPWFSMLPAGVIAAALGCAFGLLAAAGAVRIFTLAMAATEPWRLEWLLAFADEGFEVFFRCELMGEERAPAAVVGVAAPVRGFAEAA